MRCFINKILISHALDRNRAPGRSVEGHVGRCAGCQRFYSESLSLKEGLKAAASTHGEAWDRILTDRIMERIDGEAKIDNRRSLSCGTPLWRRPRVVVLAACLALAVTAGMILFDGVDDDGSARDDVAASLEAVTALGQKLLGGRFDGESAAALLGLVAEPLGLVVDPLTAEVDRLADDAEAMRGFVVAILPINLLHIESKGESSR